MCTTRILAQSKAGFINQCTECESIHLAFGTALLRLTVDEFMEISSHIYYDVQHVNNRINPNSKNIQIPHPSGSEFSLVLSTNELSQLNEIVQEANILLTAYNLISNDNN